MIERFFTDVRSLLYIDTSLQELISKLVDQALSKALINALKKKVISYTLMNQALINEEIKTVVWTHFNFDHTVVVPMFSDALIYGIMSEVLHSNYFNKIIVSDKSSLELKSFFNLLADYYKKPLEEFDEMHSVLDEEQV